MPTHGNTTQRGLGWAHQRRREQLLAVHLDGTPCARCGKPMYLAQRLDAGHTQDRALGGGLPDRLEHRRCNRQAGAYLRNVMYGRGKTSFTINAADI